MIARISFSPASVTTYNTLSTAFTTANIWSAQFFGTPPSFFYFGGYLNTFSNIEGGSTLPFKAGFIMKMSLAENFPYNTETCTSYSLIFGPANDYAFYSLPHSIILGSGSSVLKT